MSQKVEKKSPILTIIIAPGFVPLVMLKLII